MLQAHYRSNLDFTNDAILAAEKGFYRLFDAVETLNKMNQFKISEISSLEIDLWIQSCYDAMNDDFNTPILIANLFEGVRFINLLKENSETITEKDLKSFVNTMNTFVFDVLGLANEKGMDQNNDKLEGVVTMLISMRKKLETIRILQCQII